MARFSKKSPEKQALSIVKALGKTNAIQSIRTLDSYHACLVHVARNLKEYGINIELRDLTPTNAIQYLEIRGGDVGQKQLDMERQAMQAMFRHVTSKLDEKQTLRVVPSEIKAIEKSRAYTSEQAMMVSSAQNTRNGLATQIAYAAGLRAHELLTLLPISEREPDQRPAASTKFNGLNGVRYTVKGKGGLIREVSIPVTLATQLESRRLENTRKIVDRGINYSSQYDIAGGQTWSNSFSAAAKRALGWSEGAHGLRHSYAQTRMNTLQNTGLPKQDAMRTVSQELGHFRPDITLVYLR